MTETTKQNELRDSIVKESDFPEKSNRFQELMAKYRNDNPGEVSSFDGKTTTSFPEVKVSNQLKTKTFDDLSPEVQERLVAKIANIDYTVSSAIQQYGSLKESPLTENSSRIIAKYSASDFGEISASITELVASIKTNTPANITDSVKPAEHGEKWGVISSLREMFSLKKARKRLQKALSQQQSISKNIQSIEVFLQKQQLDLQKDVEIYEQMGRDTYSQLSEFEVDQIGLQLMIESATKELNEIASKGEVDMMEHSRMQTLKNAIERMERRKYTVETIRIATLQSVPELAILIRGDEIIIEKIDEVESLVIPMWKWQYAIAIGALRQQEALSIQKTIRGITSKLITGNAKMLHDNMIAAQEELYAAAIAVEDLVIVQDYIDDMVVKVGEVRKEASSKAVEGMKKMAEIEQKNKNLLSQTN